MIFKIRVCFKRMQFLLQTFLLFQILWILKLEESLPGTDLVEYQIFFHMFCISFFAYVLHIIICKKLCKQYAKKLFGMALLWPKDSSNLESSFTVWGTLSSWHRRGYCSQRQDLDFHGHIDLWQLSYQGRWPSGGRGVARVKRKE